ncbi:MAG TPA: hypothetical protein VME18_07810 [Acidobacteriaceae bacterium]|nr:hypothetical protein [Acidobacteriaceae bacterium]
MKLLARLSLLALVALPVSLAAATISGTVTDRTTNKPATGDNAVLLDLSQGMQESARTTIDAQGHFSFTLPSLAGMHLVRVEHEKADYYGPVPPNTSTVNIDVFDVAPKVEGVHVYADVVRMQTDSQGLNVTENYFIRNESKPPLTQFSDHAFPFSLPSGAIIQGGGATGPGGMEVQSSPVPLRQKNQYAFVFPLRPGETEFQVAYSLPYSGSLAFHPAVSMPTDNLAVMIPTSMSFSGGSAFQALHGDADEPGTQTWLATNVQPGMTVAYTVSGTGSMPREAQNAQEDNGQGGSQAAGGGQGGQDQPAAQNGAPGGGLAPPVDTPDPLEKYKWWILSSVGLALVIVAAFMLRAKPGLELAGGAPLPTQPSPLMPAVPPGTKATALRAELAAHAPPPASRSTVSHFTAPAAPVAPAAGSSMLAALKEELFTLETERLEGKLSEAEYTQLKSALEVVMRRALARQTPTR